MASPNSGFSSQTKIFNSLHPSISYPPSTTPFSLPHYVFSLISSSPNSASASLIDAATGRRIPLAHLLDLVQSLAFNLRRKFNIHKNDVALILSPNSIQIPLLYLSLLSLGAILSPSNPLSSDSDISHQIDLSRPSIAFVSPGNVARLPPLREGVVVLDSPEFESLLVTGSTGFNGAEVFQNDTAAILYSSGTTGRVKGVELTHRNFIASIAGVHAVRAIRPSPAVTLCTVPFFHVYGFLLCLREVALGGSMVVAAGSSVDIIFRAVEEFKVTHLAVAPPSVVAMVKNPVQDKYELSSLEVVMCGGAPVASSVIERFNRRFSNISLLQAYGLTETTGGVTRTFEGGSGARGANGHLVSNCQARIVDPLTGRNLPPLKPGELWIRGPTVMKGYVGDEEETAAMVDSEGWLRTGDICFFDNNGLLFYVERLKELIKYKAYQIAPAELEDLLLSHPAIVDAAVVPYPDDDAGQVPVAFVVKQPGSAINDSLIMDFVAQKVAPYKKIRRVFYTDSIPKNTAGKVLRKELIKQATNVVSKL